MITSICNNYLYSSLTDNRIKCNILIKCSGKIHNHSTFSRDCIMQKTSGLYVPSFQLQRFLKVVAPVSVVSAIRSCNNPPQ